MKNTQRGSAVLIGILIILLVIVVSLSLSSKKASAPINPINTGDNYPVSSSTQSIPSIPPVVSTTSRVPTIRSIYPLVGSAGSTATMSGAGFLSTNTVLFSGGPVHNTTATNGGTLLTFTVPSSVGADCDGKQVCPMYQRLITPGTYSVSVRNANGVSNSVSFEVK